MATSSARTILLLHKFIQKYKSFFYRVQIILVGAGDSGGIIEDFEEVE